jgi:hypothetical protein
VANATAIWSALKKKQQKMNGRELNVATNTAGNGQHGDGIFVTN